MNDLDARTVAVLAAADTGRLHIANGHASIDTADGTEGVTDVVVWALTTLLPLLVRGSNGLVLTDAGRALLDAHTLLAVV